MIPKYVYPFLWSYKINSLDEEKDKKCIIMNVLNLGTKKATDWLFSRYSQNEIQEVIQRSYATEWSPKSLNYWKLILEVFPERKTRF